MPLRENFEAKKAPSVKDHNAAPVRRIKDRAADLRRTTFNTKFLMSMVDGIRRDPTIVTRALYDFLMDTTVNTVSKTTGLKVHDIRRYKQEIENYISNLLPEDSTEATEKQTFKKGQLVYFPRSSGETNMGEIDTVDGGGVATVIWMEKGGRHMKRLLFSKLKAVNYKEGKKEGSRYNSEKRYAGAIPDGFIDGGRSARYFDNRKEADQSGGKNDLTPTRFPGESSYGVSSREFIIVDRKVDKFLADMIKDDLPLIKKLPGVKAQVQALAKLVYKKASGSTTKKSSRLIGKVLLGDAFKKGAAVCRHRTLLFQVLAKELGLPTAMRKGSVRGKNGKMTPHAWNEINIKGKWMAIDTTYTKNSPEKIMSYKNLPNYGVIQGNKFTSIDDMG